MERDPNVAKELEKISELVSQTGKQMPFALPDGYFPNLLLEISDRITYTNEIMEPEMEEGVLTELKRLSPILANMEKINPFHRPAGYDGIKGINKTADRAGGKTIPMRGLRRRSWIPYAAAAALITFIAGTVYISTDRDPNSPQQTRLVKEYHSDSLPISDEALTSYLLETGDPETLAISGSGKPEEDITRLLSFDPQFGEWLSDVPEAVLDEYLCEHPEMSMTE
jgi:hypothetical protein